MHGISNEFLLDKPTFAEVVNDFLAFVRGAELIIHNAPFDVGFLDAELARIDEFGRVDECCAVLDTLVVARQKHPGQRNSLDALCGRYDIDNSRRDKHGALLDAEILADVYLAMSGGQRTLSLDAAAASERSNGQYSGIRRIAREGGLPIATGVVEGACRHLVKDRMDVTGARWSLNGAEALLRMRSLKASNDLDAYWGFHARNERVRHYAPALKAA
mgnify:CR=1 FL=1